MLASGHSSADWRCSRCAGEKHKDGDKMRKSRGCDGPSKMLHLPYAPNTRRCPRSQITADVWIHVENWHRWKRFGLTPYGGSLDVQPLYIAQGIEEVDNARESYRAELAKEQPNA